MVTKWNFVFSLIHCQESLIASVQVQVNCKKSIWKSDQEDEKSDQFCILLQIKTFWCQGGTLLSFQYAYQLSPLPQLTSAQIFAAKMINKPIINN